MRREGVDEAALDIVQDSDQARRFVRRHEVDVPCYECEREGLCALL